jgi:hypothetical protein
MAFRTVPDLSHLYFFDASTTGKKPLFDHPEFADIALDALAQLRAEGRIKLFAYALLPTQIQAVLIPEDATPKQFTDEFVARSTSMLLRQMRLGGDDELLRHFLPERRNTYRSHNVWEDLRTNRINTIEYLAQKVEQVHNLPTEGSEPLVEMRAAYPFSSACFYDLSQEPPVAVDDVRQWY